MADASECAAARSSMTANGNRRAAPMRARTKECAGASGSRFG
jgi:hypothetical protein